jgi:LIM domain-binding protein 1
MIVGEPSLMGGEMDDEDERYITRLENTQYDPSSSLLQPKQQLITNFKREQVSFPGSPQQQQQQQLPSMFSNNSPTAINGDLLTTGKKISTNSPQTPSANQV